MAEWQNHREELESVEKCRANAAKIEAARHDRESKSFSAATSGRRRRGEAQQRGEQHGKGLFRQAFPACSQRTTPPPSSRSANHAVGRVSDESDGRASASLPWAHVAAPRAPPEYVDRPLVIDRDPVVNKNRFQ